MEEMRWTQTFKIKWSGKPNHYLVIARDVNKHKAALTHSDSHSSQSEKQWVSVKEGQTEFQT